MEQCLVLGGGLSGRAAVRLARRIGLEPVMISDGPEVGAGQAVAGYPLIVASPGVKPLSSPLYRAAMRRVEAGEAELISELEFGYRALPAPRRLLAVTGTNGKTTTTELTCHLLQALGVKAVPAGNIGLPLSDIACDMLEGRLGPETLPVVEVSSFQLERIRDFAPVAAVLLNLESDHIDRYAGGLAEYKLVKFRIFQSVPAENQLFGLSMTLPVGRRVTVEGHELLVDGKPLVDLTETRLDAPHNRENLAAAVELVLRVVPAGQLFAPEFTRAVETFAPGRHRLETVAVRHGITFINDSKATNPASVIAALNSLPDPGSPNIVILLGGLDKGLDFSSLASQDRRRHRRRIPGRRLRQRLQARLRHRAEKRRTGRHHVALPRLRQHGYVQRLQRTRRPLHRTRPRRQRFYRKMISSAAATISAPAISAIIRGSASNISRPKRLGSASAGPMPPPELRRSSKALTRPAA